MINSQTLKMKRKSNVSDNLQSSNKVDKQWYNISINDESQLTSIASVNDINSKSSHSWKSQTKQFLGKEEKTLITVKDYDEINCDSSDTIIQKTQKDIRSFTPNILKSNKSIQKSSSRSPTLSDMRKNPDYLLTPLQKSTFIYYQFRWHKKERKKYQDVGI